MRYLFILLLITSTAYGQALVPFGGTRPTDTAYAARSLRIDSVVRLVRYGSTDSNKVLGVDAGGRLVLRTKTTGGGGSVDSSVYATIARLYKVADSVANEIPTVNDYVPYTGAVANVDLGNYNLKTDTITGTGAAGLHLHGDASNSGIEISGFGYVRMDAYPTTTIGDSVLSTNSNGFIQLYDLKSKFANYATTAALADSVSSRQKYSDTSTFDATRSWVIGQIPSTSGFVPYTGATSNVDLGNNSITAKDGIINHASGSGTALSVTKGGAGIGLFVNKTSGSGNAMEVQGGVTLLETLHLTNSLQDAYISSAATWNAKQNFTDTTTWDATKSWVTSQGYGASTTIAAGTGISVSGSVPTYTVTNTAPDQTVSLTGAGTVSVTGTYPTFTVTGTGGSGGVTSITSTGSTIQVTGTTTVNVEVDTTHPFTFTGTNTFTRDITVDSASIGTGNGLSTNVRFGRSALPSATTATRVIALGENTANKITTGTDITLVGHGAGANTSVSVNGLVGVGRNTLNYSTGDNNTAIGTSCMARAVAWNGIANAGVGANSGNALTSGSSNSWLGAGAANALTSGSSNTFVGVNSGNAITTGGQNTIIGAFTGNSGGLDIRTLSNRVVLSDGGANIRAYHNGTNWLIGTVTDGSTGILQLSGSLGLNTAGNKINIATGSQASVGTGTLSGGTAEVNTTAVTANSIIQVQLTSCSSCGTLYIGTVTAGTKFIVNSTNGSDASTFNYWIIN